MNVDHDSPAIGATRAPGEFKSVSQTLPAWVTKAVVLDVIERTIVLLLFLYFANR